METITILHKIEDQLTIIQQQLADLTNRIDHLEASTMSHPKIVPYKYRPPYPWQRREDDPHLPRRPWQGPRIDRWGRR